MQPQQFILNTPTKSRIAVAMSGGVDSSVAAALLRQEGYDIFGLTMRLPRSREFLAESPPPDADDEPMYIQDARRTAENLGIPLYVMDIREQFREQIIRYFCEEYYAGRTPNPCVYCNPTIKFGTLFGYAQALGAEGMATGHYVKREYHAAYRRYVLRAASNAAKDQSYFLYRLSQEQLARSLFPLGGMTKEEVRHIARTLGLQEVAEKSESQEICFVSDQSYQQFLDTYFPAGKDLSGNITNTSGRVLGTHQGIHLYTIGQRKGLGVALGSPRYVVELNPETKAVVIGENQELFSSRFSARDLSMMALERLSAPLNCQVKIRYRNAATPATVLPGETPEEAIVILEQPQRAVTPGQSAVFYDGDIVLGGGIIERARIS
ncbi:tRNA/5-methylaminomethyl-2-thiouridylate-methyltransferase [Candidatus Moduliflexus flocculans]|uniref:tRNA-specific 2-thiouridylase MnmA n=1 Tax=Candidatus Moduliflexus flocculans TaxID=1499966 RepID=A0A081BPY8_9BACT|nr:tRNA/5-methylaminomethyl-2-thiouridylate-methyltransferase [Candidatus Moduliflexus flocculans]